MIEVSIIIIHYNRFRFLLQQLAEYTKWSDKTKFEFIVIDNYSIFDKDKNFLISNYDWIKFIFLDKNYGPSHARNEGVEASKGHYIQFIDDDDLVTFEKIDSQSQYLNAHSDIDVIIGPSEKTNWSCDEVPNHKSSNKYFPSFYHANTCSDLVSSDGFFPAASALFKKELLLKVACFDKQRWCIEDVHLYLKLLKAGAKLTVEKNLPFGFFWRSSENRQSLSTTNQVFFIEGCLLNFFYCIDNNMLHTKQDYKIIYYGIYNYLNQNITLNQEIYLKGLSELKNQSCEYLPKVAIVGKLIGFNTLFKVLSFYRRIKILISH